MPEQTPNIGIKKPLGNETVNRVSFNENYDIIDVGVGRAQAEAAEAQKKAMEAMDKAENITVPVTSINEKTGDVEITKNDVGLGNVINSRQVPDTRKVNNKALSADITLTAADVGAETTAGAQDKATSALNSAKKYVDDEVISMKGQPNGFASLDAYGHIPQNQLNMTFAGQLNVHVTPPGGVGLDGTMVRVKNAELNFDYAQSIDSLNRTEFSLLSGHTYSVSLDEYPEGYYYVPQNITIFPNGTNEMDFELSTEPPMVGWRENVSTGEIEYTDRAIGMTPMKISNGTLHVGSWADHWLCHMRPCLLKNGVVQYYLRETGTFMYDYSRRADGAVSDIVSGADGDVMIEFPKMYYKFYTETNSGTKYIGCRYAQSPLDDTWCCNAWLNRNGTPQDTMYMAAYDGHVSAGTLHSLSGKMPTINTTIGDFRTAAHSNGTGYEQQEWSKRVYVQSLLPMLFKGLDSQVLVGQGVTSANKAVDTGTMNGKPLFWGNQSKTDGVKFAGIENFWGNIYKWADGLINVSNTYKYKIYAPYNDAGSGYLDAGGIGGAVSSEYIDTVAAANGYGLLPSATVSAELDSFFHDRFWKNTTNTYVCDTGGYWSYGADAGAWYLSLGLGASDSGTDYGASLSFTPQ